MSDEKSQDRKEIAEAVLRFLEEKDDTKKWLVIVYNEQSQIHHDLSGGFHIVKVNGFFAAAISAGQTDFQDFSNVLNAQLQSFKFPVETFKKRARMALKTKGSARSIYQHFRRFLATQISGHLDFEIFVFVTPVGEKTNDYVTIVASDDFKGKKITNQDKRHMYLVGVITNSTSVEKSDPMFNPSMPIRKCHNIIANGWSPIYGLLRNEMVEGHLTVLGDAAVEGAYITVDPEWRNETGQKWTFVNNTLRNGNGKCLTARTERSTYLYQYDCHPEWVGQSWIKYGLQIFNGYGYCLSIQIHKDEGTIYVIQDKCDSTPQFLWYNWDVDCEEPIVPSLLGENGIQPLH